MPGPSGFRPAGARFVGALARSPLRAARAFARIAAPDEKQNVSICP
ncbi:hypothetical protein [Oricola nitratireducens]|nr:hypothetical protein [Oricola nitratireducens]